MRTRQEIKEIAKVQLAQNRSACICVYLLTIVIAGALSALTFGFASLLTPAVTIAGCGFFVCGYNGVFKTAGEWFNTLFDDFLHRLGGYLWMLLWTFLWALLLWIPGVVKAIAYSLTPYILIDCPKVSAKDALKLSMRMTNGYKIDIFIAELSFIGWSLLSALTFGILEVLYVGPYHSMTFAGIYQELKQNALDNGVVTPEQLEGAPIV